MRLVTVEHFGAPGTGLRHGLLRDDQSFVDLAAADASLGLDMLGLVRLGPEGIDRARGVLDDVDRDEDRARASGILLDGSEVRLRAPLPRPNSLRDFLLVEGHIRNARKADPPDEWYKLPIYYKGNVDAIIGPDDVVAWPRYTERLDFEIEVCAVIGQPTREVLAEDADASIVGYLLFNDWSARDIQRREQSVGLGPGLGKDFANAIGPWILTTDEFDVEGAQLRAAVDGETWSHGTLNGMRFTFPEIIEWLSMEQTLQPGDLLGSGTIAGGSGAETGRQIQPGQTVELSGTGLGTLRNIVGERPAGPLVTEPRPNPARRPSRMTAER